MTEDNQKRLEPAGSRVGDTIEFLSLAPDEAAPVEARVQAVYALQRQSPPTRAHRATQKTLPPRQRTPTQCR